MATVARRPDAEAVVQGDTRVTYAALARRVLASARAMIAAGVVPGDRVAVWAPNSLGWIVAALGGAMTALPETPEPEIPAAPERGEAADVGAREERGAGAAE